MAGPVRVVLRRRFPFPVLYQASWYLLIAAVVDAALWGIFGPEPLRPAGRLNPLALLPRAAVVVAACGLVPFAVALFRRPRLAADHYALTVRPGIGRQLILPWASIAEIACRRPDSDEPGGDSFLLVRLVPTAADPLTDRPHWWDKAALRAARRQYPSAAAFDLAIRHRRFAGPPRAQLAWLAAFAPPHVVITRSFG